MGEVAFHLNSVSIERSERPGVWLVLEVVVPDRYMGGKRVGIRLPGADEDGRDFLIGLRRMIDEIEEFVR